MNVSPHGPLFAVPASRQVPLHVVALSGGKDSSAMALRLLETEPRDYTYIGNWTGNELPAFFAHLRRLEGLIGKPITPVRHSTDLFGVIEEQNMIPNFRSRFCTRILKIEPTIRFFKELPAGSVLYVGLRADEEARRGLFGEDIDLRFPMRDWGWNEAQVWQYLAEQGVEIPERTDCAVCPYQRLGEWHALWKDHPELYAEGVAIEEKYGHTFRSAQRDTWPAGLKELSAEFESGRPIRRSIRSTSCRVCRL